MTSRESEHKYSARTASPSPNCEFSHVSRPDRPFHLRVTSTPQSAHPRLTPHSFILPHSSTTTPQIHRHLSSPACPARPRLLTIPRRPLAPSKRTIQPCAALQTKTPPRLHLHHQRQSAPIYRPSPSARAQERART